MDAGVRRGLVEPHAGNRAARVGAEAQIEHGHAGPAPVVNDQTKLLASALPARSFTPLAPPVIVAVYVVDAASATAGDSVAVLVPAL